MLSDLGADVVKVEDPDPGDYLREISPGMFAALNRGKRSVVLDFRGGGAEVLRRLCGAADVLMESFRPGVLERFLPPPWPERLVVCRLSGFGQDGPWRDRAGHDIGYLALSGVLARNRGLPRVQLADLFGGAQQAVIGVLAALLERARTRRGRLVDVSLTHGVTGLLIPYLGDEIDVLDGTRPCYRVYRCKDGRSFALGALEPKFWQAFCGAVGKPAWADRGMDVSLAPEMEAFFAARTRDEWDALLRPADCCGEPVLEPGELRTHPLFAGLFSRDLPRTYPALSARVPDLWAPARGEHTAEVLHAWLPSGSD